jgi:presenilin-like A22 family membrane protease
MKHTLAITLILVIVFFFTQIIGLAITAHYIDFSATTPEQFKAGNITWKTLPGGIERPEVEEDKPYLVIVYITVALIIGTILVLIIAKFGWLKLWKLWYFVSVVVCLWFSLGSFLQWLTAIIIATILALWKILRKNIYIHNLTELLIYGGLAAIFVPIKAFTPLWAFLLLVFISIYDIWAVRYSKHMVSMANFQSESSLFAGLFIPYERTKKLPKNLPKSQMKKVKIKNAVLGGGDIGFPLIFTGVVMKTTGFWPALIIPIFTTLSLLYLLLIAKEDKFYPAMPFITVGCIVGYLVMFLLGFV